MDLFVNSLIALVSIVNPLGAVPLFLALTPTYTQKDRSRSARQTSIYSVLILGGFFLAGAAILGFFGISLQAVRIAGGIIILNSGFSLLNGRFEQSRAVNEKVKEEALHRADISFTPMAMPMLSGPGSISFLISAFAEHQNWVSRGWIGLAIIVTGIIIYLILRSSAYLHRMMGETGLKVISRIMGFLVMAIGTQYIIAGIYQLINDLN
ncbi:MAG: MarC family NAAT transporter [Saprospiraceae bacterium]|nr:MarC family NAAT transporter [Saprospiraceae bacterium]